MDVVLPGEIARFKVFPAGRRSKCYWLVRVFKNRRHMRRAFRKLDISGDKDDRFSAIVMPIERMRLIGRRWKSEPFLGYALFARNYVLAEVLCHEAVHMATGYLRRIRKLPRLRNQIDNGEERLAYYTGWCGRQLNNGFHKSKCYRGQHANS